MLFLVLAGCTSVGFERPVDPDSGSFLGSQIGVDPFSGQVWGARVQTDTAVLAELQELSAQEELSEADAIRYGELFEELHFTQQEHVFRIDPSRSYRRDFVGTYLGGAGPLVLFGAAGPVMGSLPVDVDGRPTSERRSFEQVDGEGRLQAQWLTPSPTGAWFLASRAGEQLLFGADLALASRLRGLGSLQWSPQGSLVELADGELRFYAPGTMQQQRSLPIRILEPGVRVESLRAISPNERRFLLNTVRGEGEQEIRGAYLLDLGSGQTLPLDSAFRFGRFTGQGALYCQDGDRLRFHESVGMDRSYLVDAGAVWVDDTGQWAVFEDEEGFGYRDLIGGAAQYFTGNLRGVEIIQDTLWVRVDTRAFPIDLLTGVAGRGISDCSVSDFGALPDGNLALRCDEDWSSWSGDEDGVADESVLFVDGITGALISRVWL